MKAEISPNPKAKFADSAAIDLRASWYSCVWREERSGLFLRLLTFTEEASVQP
jgi:hypothetical protein